MNFDKKYLFLSTSLFFKLLINVLVVFYIAKKVSLVDFGSFSLAFIFSTVAISLLDYGFNLKSLILTGAKQKKVSKELYLMLYGKIIITIVFIIIFLLFILATHIYDSETKLIITILTFSSIPASFGNFYLNSFKLINKYQEESKGFFIQGGLLILLLIINNFFGKNTILYYAIIITITRFLYFFYSKIVFRKQFWNKEKVTQKEVFKTLRKATPFAIHLILGVLIIYIDTFFLSMFSSLEDVGVYQASMRIIMATMLIAVIISDAFIPEISKMIKDKQDIQNKLSELFEFVIFVFLLVGTTMFFYSKTIIQLLFSDEYLILDKYNFFVIGIIFLRYLGIVPGVILTSFNKQSTRANAVIAAVIFSILFNILLIPRFGVKGAFISSLIAHIVLNIVYLYSSIRIIHFIQKKKKYLLMFFLISINIIFQNSYLEDSSFCFYQTILINAFLIIIYSYKKVIMYSKVFL